MTDTLDWSVSDVANYLETLGLGVYKEKFIENHVSGEVLPLLTENHLKELSIKSIGHRITFMQFLKTIKKDSSATKTAYNTKDQLGSKKPNKNRAPSTGKNNEHLSSQKKSQKQRQLDDFEKPDDGIPPPKTRKVVDEDDSPASWQQKRLMAIKRMQKKGGIQQPEMNFGNMEENSFGYGNNKVIEEEKEEPLEVNPNPFSRDEEDPNYIPPKTTNKTKPPLKTAPSKPKAKPQIAFEIDEQDFGDDYYAEPPKGGGGLRNSLADPPINNDIYEYHPPKSNPKTTKNNKYGKSEVNNLNNNNDFGGYDRPTKPLKGGIAGSGGGPSLYDEGASNRVQCSICGRRFAEDRIAKHEEACYREQNRKKKVFDSSKMRVQGTEAAQFQNKSSQPEPVKPKSNFREAHEALVENLRAARKFTEYEKARAEGKAVGPPPQMPKYEMPNDDRQECPFCHRKFGSDALAKHRPVCERMNGGRMNTIGKKPAVRGR